VTNGGVVAKVMSVDESFATLEIADGVVIKLGASRSACRHLLETMAR
jgi:preprotein translocase subunit YajC